MNREDLSHYLEALASKKEELVNYAETQIKQISYPTPPSVTTSQQPSSPYLSYIGLGIGIVLLAIGIGTKTNAIAVGGGVVTAAGIYGVSRKRNTESQPQAPAINYFRITEKIGYQIQKIHAYVSDSWYDFLGGQQKSLKNLIETSGFDAESKNKMIELCINRSLIQYSMMDVLSDLNRIEKEQNIEAYKQYVAGFVEKYRKAIEEAYLEQKRRYEAIIQLVK